MKWGKDVILENGIPLKQHMLLDGYFNGWVIPSVYSNETKEAQEIIIEYAPQRLLDAGIYISLSVSALCVSLLILRFFIIRKRISSLNAHD